MRFVYRTFTSLQLISVCLPSVPHAFPIPTCLPFVSTRLLCISNSSSHMFTLLNSRITGSIE